MPRLRTPSTSDELAAHGIVLESAPCVFCGRDGGRPVVVARDRLHAQPGWFQVVACDGCGVLRTEPRPALASMGRYYPSAYYDTIVDDNAALHPIARWQARRWKALPVAPPGRLLELGAATGAFLQEAQRAGWDVSGVEIDPEAARRAAARTGVAIQQTDVGAARFEPASFDVVCAWMVLEHLHDPRRALQQAFTWLEPGGTLALSIQDAGSWMFRAFREAWFCLDLPRHLYHFSPATITTALEFCGYTDVRVHSPGTIHALLLSLSYWLEDRRWMARATSRRLINSLPVRLAAFAGGLLASPFHFSGMMLVWARKPKA